MTRERRGEVGGSSGSIKKIGRKERIKGEGLQSKEEREGDEMRTMQEILETRCVAITGEERRFG